MRAAFLCGPLVHAALRAVVLGGEVAVEAGSVRAGLVRAGSLDGSGAVGRTGNGAAQGAGDQDAQGCLVRLDADQAARLAFYASVTGQAAVACEVAVAGGPVAAVLYAGGGAVGDGSGADGAGGDGSGGDGAVGDGSGADCSGEDGSGGDGAGAALDAGFAAETVAAARDVMALYGVVPPDVLARRYAIMLGRGAARVRAAAGGPVTLRRAQGAGDVALAGMALPYANYFAVEEHDLRFRRFDGSFSDTVKRAAFVMGDAVTVLPYDPVRDRVLLVEQFRAGPYVRGDAECWSLEAIAGRIDAGESPQDAARREAVEEAGLRLGALELVAGYYPTPGAVTEFLYSYVAVTDLPDNAAGVFGVEGEAEDIRGHLVGFDRLMELVATGEVNNAPLMLTALWLQRERRRLRGL